MDQQKFSLIAHGTMPLWNPLEYSKLLHTLFSLPLSKESVALDVGCGRGEVLIELARHYGLKALGVDTSKYAIEKARKEAGLQNLSSLLRFYQKPFEEKEFSQESLDLILCIGATHAIGSYENALEVLHKLLRPQGYLVIGEGYWKQDPPPEYLRLLEAKKEDYLNHTGNQNLALSKNFTVISTLVANKADWERYENQYKENIEAYLYKNPATKYAREMKERIENWHHGYQTWGKETLGFGLYLLQKN